MLDVSMATRFHLLAMSINICAAAWSPQYWSSGSQRLGVSATTGDVKYWPPTVAVWLKKHDKWVLVDRDLRKLYIFLRRRSLLHQARVQSANKIGARKICASAFELTWKVKSQFKTNCSLWKHCFISRACTGEVLYKEERFCSKPKFLFHG